MMMNPLPQVGSSDSLTLGYKRQNLPNQPQHVTANFSFPCVPQAQPEAKAKAVQSKVDPCSNPILKNCISQLKSVRKNLGEDHKEVADYWSALGLCRMHTQRDLQEALVCFEKSLTIYRNKNLRRDVAIALLDVGSCLERMDRTQEALEKYQEALSIFEAEQVSENHPQVLSAKRALARIQRT